MKLALASLGALLVLNVSANALEITNDDTKTYSLEIESGQGDTSVQIIDIEPGETIADFCEEGCMIRIGAGAQEVFDGGELLLIKNGEFEIVE